MAPAATVRDTVPTSSDRSSPSRRGRWRRLCDRLRAGDATNELRAARLERLLALLEDARGQVGREWVQGGWWSVGTGSSPSRVTDGLAAATMPPEHVRGACLVAALVRAGRGPDAEVACAVDVVYDALWESFGRAGGAPSTGLPPISAPNVRLARVQTLTRWNDDAGRTQEQVVEVLDRAIARTVQSIVALPATAGPARTGVPAGQ